MSAQHIGLHRQTGEPEWSLDHAQEQLLGVGLAVLDVS
jgi:hypothetical protein